MEDCPEALTSELNFEESRSRGWPEGRGALGRRVRTYIQGSGHKSGLHLINQDTDFSGWQRPPCCPLAGLLALVRPLSLECHGLAMPWALVVNFLTKHKLGVD